MIRDKIIITGKSGYIGKRTEDKVSKLDKKSGPKSLYGWSKQEQ